MKQMTRPTVDAVDHLVLAVSDIAASVAFYCDVLGMADQPFQVADGSVRRALAFGSQKINLHPANGPFRPHAVQPVAGSADICFLSRTPVADWIVHFAECGVAVTEGPVLRTGAAGPILSVYVRDPDGNLIELANAV